MAIDTGHRDQSGELSQKHGNTLIRALRKIYGPTFAKACGDLHIKIKTSPNSSCSVLNLRERAREEPCPAYTPS